MNIVQELRDRAARRNLSSIAYAADCSIDLAAANEIERLMRVVFFYAAECHGECCPDRHRDGLITIVLGNRSLHRELFEDRLLLDDREQLLAEVVLELTG